MRQTDVLMGRGMMSRWINIDDLPSGRVEWDYIFDAPSIDIVRCKECKYWQSDGGTMMVCEVYNFIGKSADDFCSWGEPNE